MTLMILTTRTAGSKLIVTSIIVGVALRLLFVFAQPFTADEGFYVSDAQILLAGRVPAGDALTKAPVPISLFALSQAAFNRSLFAARLMNVVVSLAGAYGLWLTFKSFRLTKSASIAFCLWLLGSSPIIFHSLGHTQAIAAGFASLTLGLWAAALFTRKKYLGFSPSHLAFLAGISFIAAFASRKSSVALAPALIILLAAAPAYNSLRRRSVIVGILLGVTTGLAMWLLSIFSLYRWPGVLHALGWGYTNILSQSSAFLSTLWGPSLEASGRIFFNFSASHIVLGIIGLAGILLARTSRQVRPLIVGVLIWLGTILIAYMFWPAHLPEYGADMLVPLTLIAALGSVAVLKLMSKSIQTLAMAGLIALNIISLLAAWQRPLAGRYERQGIQAAAHLVQQHVPQGEPILTAATIVPYLSGHDLFRDISHPLWYRYGFISDTDRTLFLPPVSEITNAVESGQVRWLLFDQVTRYAYFRFSPQLLNTLLRKWQVVGSVSNIAGTRPNTLYLWHYTGPP